MKLPRGQLRRRRVVTDLGTPLASVLDAGLTGYVRLESQETLLLDDDGVGILTFEDGIPMAAYHTGTNTGGADAIGEMAVAGPYRIELCELDPDDLREAHQTPDLQVPAGMPAAQLAGDPSLAERTRDQAPADRVQPATEREQETMDAVESFLEDEERIASLREQARSEAQSRAKEWGFDVED